VADCGPFAIINKCQSRSIMEIKGLLHCWLLANYIQCFKKKWKVKMDIFLFLNENNRNLKKSHYIIGGTR
jgi:hypothetical protein